jgi:GDPmannose 4,6-dehydratase
MGYWDGNGGLFRFCLDILGFEEDIMETALVSGCTGQIGSYICEKLLAQDFKVYGIKRRSSSLNTQRLDHIFNHPNLHLEYGDITDYSSISNIVSKTQPTIFINCAAQSHVRVSFDIALATHEATGTGVLHCLEAIRVHSPNTKFITMSSSEMFGKTPPPQNEQTPFQPQSPYACSKLYGYYATINYREAYKLHCSNAICFNTESPRRGETFATRKITRAATRIKLGLQDKLYMGNLDAKRDWSHAIDSADAICKIVMAEQPNDYVIASGEMHSVREFAEIVFSKLGMDYREYMEFDPIYLRAAEVDALCGDSSKLRNTLGWKPKYTFEMLIDEMIASDMELAKKEKLLRDNL